jgi:hypothetical protein
VVDLEVVFEVVVEVVFEVVVVAPNSAPCSDSSEQGSRISCSSERQNREETNLGSSAVILGISATAALLSRGLLALFDCAPAVLRAVAPAATIGRSLEVAALTLAIVVVVVAVVVVGVVFAVRASSRRAKAARRRERVVSLRWLRAPFP